MRRNECDVKEEPVSVLIRSVFGRRWWGVTSRRRSQYKNKTQKTTDSMKIVLGTKVRPAPLGLRLDAASVTSRRSCVTALLKKGNAGAHPPKISNELPGE